MNSTQKAIVKKTNKIINVRMVKVNLADVECLRFEDVSTGDIYGFADLSFNIGADFNVDDN